MTDEKLKDKLVSKEKTKIYTAVNETISWPFASYFEKNQKELESTANPAMQKLYYGAEGAFPGGARDIDFRSYS